MNRRTDREIALHESCHAYAAIWKGCKVYYLTIRQDGEKQGACEHDSPNTRWAAAVIAAAGAQGARLMMLDTLRKPGIDWLSDSDVTYVSDNCPSGRSHMGWFSAVNKEARRIVKQGRKVIEALADALEEARELDASQIQEIVSAADPRLSPPPIRF